MIYLATKFQIYKEEKGFINSESWHEEVLLGDISRQAFETIIAGRRGEEKTKEAREKEEKKERKERHGKKGNRSREFTRTRARDCPQHFFSQTTTSNKLDFPRTMVRMGEDVVQRGKEKEERAHLIQKKPMIAVIVPGFA